MKTRLLILLTTLFLSVGAIADEIVLKSQHPTNYVIKSGDTLWDIASRFLRDPWRWPDIWQVNPQIENPHLIYPGDEVVLTFKDGKPRLELRRASSSDGLRVIKLSPQVRRETLQKPIPTIPIDAIQQFLSRPSVMHPRELDKAPYIVSSLDEHLVSGIGDKVYVRGIVPGSESRYSIVRAGETYYRDKDKKGEALGTEALYVGEAMVTQYGDPTSLEITHSAREILIGDRLVPAEAQKMDFSFTPHAPDNTVRGKIIAVVDGVSRIGQYQVVVINQGQAQGIEKGHVLAVYQSGLTVRDTVDSERGKTVTLPDERTGYLMVFRPFDKVSYALVMKAVRDMRVYDMVVNP